MLEKDRHRGTLAKQILENEIYKEAFSEMEKAIFSEWKHSKDEDQREALWIMIQMMPRFEATLTASINHGAVASEKLQYLNPSSKSFANY